MRKTILFAAILSFTLTACSPISVQTEYDQNIHFAEYKTFKWAPYPKGGKKKVQPNSLLDKRIRSAVERELQTLGFQIISDGKPDALLTYHVGVKKHVDVDHYGYRYGRRRTSVRKYKENSILIDIIARDSNELIWRGAASGVVGHSETRLELIDKSIAEIFKKYPPQQ